jgi:site-specific DNA-adenine methylase
MRDRREAAIAYARRVLAASRGKTAVEKTIWGSPAGKKRLADRLVAMLPAHKTYVEPFAGSAAVLFAKEPSEVEVINDADPEIAEAYRLLKKLTPEGLDRLKKLPWVGDEKTFKGLLDAEPEDDVERLHRFLYLTHFSYAKMRGRSFSPSVVGVEAKTIKRIEQYAPRLKRVKVHCGDYEKVVRKYDAKDTVFFLDPPYPGYNVDVGESEFDEERFFALLKSLQGKFLITYGIRRKFPGLAKDSGFWVKRIRTPRTIAAMRGVGGSSVLTQLLVANYEPTLKGLDGSVIVDEWDGALDEGDAFELEKAQPFGTFGGSFHYAKRIVPLIPAHTTYVEPFAGAAAVLHAKEPSAKEVLADIDDDVVFLHRSIKAMTPERVAELRRRFEWTVTEESFAKARDMAPRDDDARFYKLVFVRTHARDCRPDGTHPAQQHLGSTTNPEKYLKAAERLKDVTILRQDYKKTLRAFDAPDTFFFVDPPYPGEWFDKDRVVDLDEFIDALAKVKGKFIAVLNPTPENVAAFKKVGHVFRLRVREASGRGGAKQAMRLFVANYPVRKAQDFELVAKCEHLPLDPSVDALVFDKTTQLVKGLDPNDERYVLGIVLEPEVVDAQGDIYSADEIRAAAHRFMEEFGGLGLMHRLRVNDQVKVLESYLAPTDFNIGAIAVRKGTWLLAVRVLSDELWDRVKTGDLTGFSIGGSARRVPEPATAPDRSREPSVQTEAAA